MIEIIQPQNVDVIWPDVAEMFAKCQQEHHGDCSVGDLWIMCRSGSAFLVIYHEDMAIKAASIWRPEHWTEGPVLRCVNLAGEDMSTWIDEGKKLLREVAIRCGSNAIIFDGRKGLRSVMPDAEIIRYTYRMAL